MPKYKTKDGVVDTTGYTESQMLDFNYDYPDAVLIEEDFQNGTAGTGAPVVPGINQAPVNGGYDFLVGSLESVEGRTNGAIAPNSFFIENPNEREVVEEYTNKRGRKVKIYADPTEEEVLRETISNLDEPEFISNSRGRKVKNPKYIAPEARPNLETQAKMLLKDNDLDIEYTNTYFNPTGDTGFVDKHYGIDNLLLAGLDMAEIADFQGSLQKDDFVKDFEKDIEGGVYEKQGGIIYTGDEVANIQVAKERTLARKLSQYMAERDNRLNDKALVNAIIENPGDFDNSKTFDEIREEAYKNQMIGYTNYDQKAVQEYVQGKFPALIAKNAENKKNKIEAYKKRREFNEKSGGFVQGLASVGEFISEIPSGFYQGLDEMGIWLDDTLNIFGGNERAKHMRLLNAEGEMADDDSLEYFYVSGKGKDINGVKYIKDEKGNIYDTSNGVNVSEILNPEEVKFISKDIDENGEATDDYSFRGGANMAGKVTGNILFDVIGTKGFGSARLASSAAYLAKANKFKSVSQLRKYAAMAERGGTNLRNIRNIGTFGKKLPFNPQMLDATMYYSFRGGVTGYESTINAAMQAGLSSAEAEKLADQAQLEMAIVYGLSTPINPKIGMVNKLDDFITKSKVFSQAVNDYKRSGSQRAFGESIKEQLKKSGLTISQKGLAFTKEGAKEVLQENVQQLGEIEFVNRRVNEEAGFNLLQQDYANDDFVNTSILSFAVGGLMGGISTPNFTVNPNKRLQNLYMLSQDLKGAKQRLSRMVETGRITQEDANGIIEQATAVGQSSNKMPAWMLKTPDALIKASVVQSQIDEATRERNRLSKPMRVDVNQRIEALEQELSNIREEAANELVTSETATIEKIVGKDNVKSFDSAAEMVSAISEIKGENYTLEDMMLDMSSDGFIEQDGVIYINKEVAAKTQAISVASHELLHKVLKSEFKNNPEMKRVVDEFKQVLKDKGILQPIEARAEMYRQQGIGDVDGADADEYFTFFSDAIAKNELPFESLQESQWVKIGKLIANLFNTRFGTKNLKFSSGQQVFDFIKDYQAGIQKGKLTGQAKKKLKDTDGEIEKKRSVGALGAINSIVPENVKTREEFLSPRVFNKAYEATIGNGVISNYVKGKSTSTEMYENTMDSIRDRLMNYNPAKDRKTKSGKPITFGEFIFANTNFAIADAKKKLAIEGEKRKRETSTDAKEAQQIAAPETSKPQAEAKAYKNLLESKVLPPEAAEGVKQKILSTTRVLKSRIDAKTSLNRTVTPLIAEIKKELGKQADIEFKKMLGAKKGGELRINLLKLKKPILENMTTTWLMQAMPFAVQKQVDGKFVSDWQGQKIDRETTDTDKAGRTAGAEIVRRIPNAVNRVSDQDFLGYMFKGEEVIRGRKEALAKAMAEEYAFDVYNQELQDTESDIRKAFEGNQERLGVELADNFVQEFSKQSERGNVKRSVSAATMQGVSTLVKAIQKKGYDNVLDGTTIIDESITNVNETAIELTIQAYDLGLMTTAPTYRFLQGIKASKVISDAIKAEAGKAVTKTSAKEVKERLAKDAETIAMALGKDVIDAIGLDGLGFINRVLDPAASKKDKITKQTIPGEEGEFFSVVKRINNNIKPSENLPTNLDLEAVSPMNSKLGVMSKIERILNKEITAEEKKEQYKKLIPEIEAANLHNKILAKHIVKTMIKLVKNGKISPVSFINILQLQTNAAKGLRALTGLKYITFKNNAQGKQKGEHLADNSTSMLEFAELAFKELDEASLNASIDEVLEFHDQWLENRALLDFVDEFGKNNPYKDRRIELLPKADQKFVFTHDLKPASELIDSRSNVINTAVKIKEGLIGFQPVRQEQKALNNARKYSYSKNPKGISVYDFDDTLAFSKSQVIVEMPAEKSMLDIAARRLFGETALKDKPGFLKTFNSLNEEQQAKVLKDVPGPKKKITPAEFAKSSEQLTAQGATFDFSEFNKVVKGTPGPLAPRLKKAISKFGNKNIFVLTARPAESANAIHAFLKGIGLEIPLENITGLANGAPAAKAAWMVGKVADGYNDFYFVDDHMGNVKAVKEALNNFDVKGKVQQARAKRSVTMSNELNAMIERNKGVRKETTYSKIKARKDGAKKGRFKAFLPYGAEDFRGLTSYVLAGKGKQGEADQKFFEDNLVRPYLRGVSAMEVSRRTLKNDFTKLLKSMPGLKKRLGKKIGETDYTIDQAVRVYLWTQQGQEVPDISKRDQKKLNSLVNKDPELVTFANGLQAISKQDQWVAPGEYWIAGSILKDINDIGEKVNRAEFLQEFIENADIIFDEKNMNKLEAIYGTRYVNALKNSLARMKSGRNRPSQPGAYEQKWLNWVNNSVGTIMFFNRRSAIMQMLSFANFVNWSDNNPLKAGVAFANQPAYWKAWSKIFNSPKLKERRGGLKSDVQEQEIANQAKNSKDKAGAVVAYLLKIGFTPTQLADSFAIATGGATFLVNRTKTYKKQGLSDAEAEAKAFEDFSAISDETQQSGDPMLISAQQASHLGRLVLAFQNTPMQYTRLMKKAAQDIANGRGDFKTNMSKILYYGFVQNLIFSALSNALFALIPGFDDDEPEEDALDKKTERILNNMIDTILRGSGLTGAVVSTLKNAIMRYQKEEEKGFTADHAYTILELINVSPPIGSKARKVYNAIQTKKFDGDVMEKQGWDPTLYGKFNVSPNYEILGSLTSAGLNVPLDRALAEVDAISEALDARNTSFQRLALGLGWRSWDVNAAKEEEEYVKTTAKKKRKAEGKKKAAETRKKKQQQKLDELALMSPEEKQAYMAEEKRRRSEAARKASATRAENKRKKQEILMQQ